MYSQRTIVINQEKESPVCLCHCFPQGKAEMWGLSFPPVPSYDSLSEVWHSEKVPGFRLIIVAQLPSGMSPTL